MQEIKKIVIIGPESTGKSTLSKALAQHYQTLWCPEYAREYLLQNGTDYTAADLLTIAKGQLKLEDEFTRKVQEENKRSLLFVDTDMYVMKVWSEYVFGTCDFFILDTIIKRKYDGYLLCNIDLPWVKDELREYPDEKPRQELFSIYKDLLINQPAPWALISGTNTERTAAAIEATNQFLQLS
ncbi:AAA family ATPase [Sediminibacterium sp.]|uniref:AAA family ATPase n=1 Tax=Sediminibacterium sp. TaxID=1917865 RepID=UPI003F6A3100